MNKEQTYFAKGDKNNTVKYVRCDFSPKVELNFRKLSYADKKKLSDLFFKLIPDNSFEIVLQVRETDNSLNE